jgi:hypothetical protein
MRRLLWLALLLTAIGTTATFTVLIDRRIHRPFVHTEASFSIEWEKLDEDEDDNPKTAVQPANGLPDPKLYPPVAIADLCVKDKWKRPRALIEGKVVLARPELDGDFHFAVEDDKGNKAVCEIIPQIPLAHPSVGDTVSVWGVVRWDGIHNWGELHGVDGWQKKIE